MSNLHERIEAFAKLGDFLRYFSEDGNHLPDKSDPFKDFSEILTANVEKALNANGWFTKENILFALKQWGALLTLNNIEYWLNSYSIKNNSDKKVAIIMAGNIPLVGFHDFLCVLLTGHQVVIKQSESDKYLLPVIIEFLSTVAPYFLGKITLTDKQLKEFDAVIATGSDNTARYFEYYFSKKPHIIRKNRNSVAVLTGDESREELVALGEDIFRYFGLGCRNVSKLFVPVDYDFDKLFNALFTYRDIINHAKYANNYDYNKAVYLMSLFELKDNGFLLLKEDEGYSSPIATLFYEYYNSDTLLRNKLREDDDKIQCIVSSKTSNTDAGFGETQKPSLNTFADGVDTVDFLLKI